MTAGEGREMEITDVKIFPVNEERLKAYVTIVLDNAFLIRDLKVIQGPSGFFVAMPSKKRKDGTYKDLAHPINAETRSKMEAVILEAYHQEAGRAASGETQAAESAVESEAAPSATEEKPSA